MIYIICSKKEEVAFYILFMKYVFSSSFLNINLVLRCPVLTPPVHGRIVGSCSRLKDSRCEFECDRGYNLTHNAPQCVVTVPDASWDGPTPFCTSNT